MFDVAAHFMDFMDTTSVTLLKSDWKCQLYELVFKPTEKHLRKYLFYFRTDILFRVGYLLLTICSKFNAFLDILCSNFRMLSYRIR